MCGGKEVLLSRRLKALAHMVTKGYRVADVGCDHGFLSIYLVQQQISPSVLAMDVRTGPLSAAAAHVSEYQLGDYIETRLSDGLVQYREGEAESLVCAGMGGRLMQKILTDSTEKAKSFRELILQPQSEIGAFRRFLITEGYRFLDENILLEDGKYYFLMKVVYDDGASAGEERYGRIQESFGPILLDRKHPILLEYLQGLHRTQCQIMEQLLETGTERARIRLGQLEEEKQLVEQALELYGM